MGQPDKITRDLAAEIDAADSANLVDVVVELVGDSEGNDMAAAKAAFERAAGPVSQVISGVGGEILGGAWLNQTLRARVPAEAVGQVADADGVSLVDVPHAIEAD
jgi:hypothetical protein